MITNADVLKSRPRSVLRRENERKNGNGVQKVIHSSQNDAVEPFTGVVFINLEDTAQDQPSKSP